LWLFCVQPLVGMLMVAAVLAIAPPQAGIAFLGGQCVFGDFGCQKACNSLEWGYGFNIIDVGRAR
jgi:hypothetical protein